MLNRIINADLFDGLKHLQEKLFHCCVTSPPYWGLRDYGIAPRIWSDGTECVYGLEKTPELFVQHTVEVFREVRRVLRDDGTLWLNFGDSYNASPGQRKSTDIAGSPKQLSNAASVVIGSRNSSNLKPGDLVNIPHRVASALQADGWYWRSTIIWAKRSPMPESISGWRWRRHKIVVGRKPVDWSKVPNGWDVGEGGHDDVSHGNYRQNENREKTVAVMGDCPGCEKCSANNGYVLRRGKWRPTTAHEYIFLLTKSDRYFCDGDAVQEICSQNTHSKGSNRHHKNGTEGVERQNGSFQDAISEKMETRNPRSVWTLSSEPYKGSHFATFPTALVRKCVEAGTSAVGCCSECGSAYAPVVESERVPTRPGTNHKIKLLPDNPHAEHGIIANLDPERHIAINRTIGHRPTCKCNVEVVSCRVLDPFGGSGTTGQVAKHLGRDYVIVEINPDYCKLAEQRIATPLREKKTKKKARAKVSASQLSLDFND